MLQVKNTIISDEVFEEDFVCNLQKCKGICCVKGDSGAPLEAEEKKILEDIYPKIKKYLTSAGNLAIESQGTSVIDIEGDLVTPLVHGKECAYVIFDKSGCTKCGIEKAYEEGEINYKKPISCHLYPIRLTEYLSFTAVNYDRWSICSDACVLGKSLNIGVFEFLKEPLIRKFGEEWYREAELNVKK